MSSTFFFTCLVVLLFVAQPGVMCWHQPTTGVDRRRAVIGTIVSVSSVLLPDVDSSAVAKCADIETCREIGERKVEQDLQDNPIIKLGSGVRYKVLNPGIKSSPVVGSDDTVDMIYSISTLSGGYMYSRGFGFEKIDAGGGKRISDQGIDSYLVKLGTNNLPIGIESALIGMKKGERRRVELPPGVGFETSNWRPEPTTARGKAKIVSYRNLLTGNGSTQPPFPAATVWDIEVLGIRGKR